jgi:hypothetical protein
MKSMNNKRKTITAVVAVFLLLLLGWFILTRQKDLPIEGPTPTYSQLTGLEVDAEVAEQPILGVMIENSIPARPQIGLDAAGIVFESLTEGGITRFLALYQEDVPEIVGPVRSLRPHFLDWAMGFDASIAHVGGSAQALQLAERRDSKSLNQFHHSKPYYRDNSRVAPHNMYAKVEDLRQLQQELDHSKSQFVEIPRSNDSPSQDPQASKVTINFSGPDYLVEFRYDAASNSYTRHLAGKPHIDQATKQPITVKNVIVIKTDGLRTIGSGEALIFKDGNVQQVRWQKTTYENRLQIIDDQGNEVPLNRGQSWFAAIPKEQSVTY